MEEKELSFGQVFGLVLGGLAVLFILIPLLWSTWGTIKAGERGVRLKMNAVVGTVDEGFYWKLPYIESVKTMNVQVQKDEVDASAASKDLQTVSSKLAINYNLSPEYVANIYKTVGRDYKAVIIDPKVQESVKAVTAKYTAEELITKRELVRDEIKNLLREKLSPYGLVVSEVNITNFDFSKSFNEAIEAKVTAEQSALAAKNKLEQVKFEAEQRITTAKGEAEAIKIQAAAIQNQGGAEYVNLKWVEKWNGQLPSTVLGDSVPMINLNK
ncbi:prohibitin family protein [bacterium]|nr:prohibitin family protein [bacterium]